MLGANETEEDAKPEMTLRASTAASVQFGGTNYSTLDEASAGNLRVVDTGDNGVLVGGQPPASGSPALTGANLQAFTDLVLPTARGGEAWGRPTKDNNRLFDGWRAAAKYAAAASALLRAPPDDSAKIQALIDSTPNVTAVLSAGIYHILTPLRLPKTGFLVGAGPDKTIILALDPMMSMVTGAGQGGSYPFHMAGVTLAGGAYGIHFEEATMGPHAQVTESFLSHVQFSNFSKAGIYMDNIYGIDNNLFAHLVFENCSKAFYQLAPASQRVPGSQQCKQAFDNPQMDYMDKTVFYRNRIIGSDRGYVLMPCRGDNLNMWYPLQGMIL